MAPESDIERLRAILRGLADHHWQRLLSGYYNSSASQVETILADLESVIALLDGRVTDWGQLNRKDNPRD